jgi:hypothetical protein
MTETTHRSLTDILADLANFTVANSGAAAIYFYHELEDTLRAQLTQPPAAIPETGAVAESLAFLDRHWASVVSRMDNTDGLIAIATLASTVRDKIRPLPEGEAERLAAQAERDARTMAPPVPGVTVNAGHTVRAVLPGHPAGSGLLESWWVAAELDRLWVTWEAYRLDGSQAGRLAYNAGHYFQSPTRACREGLNRTRALGDLAVRAGLMPEMAARIADEVTRYHAVTGPYTTGEREDRRMASRLRKWAA